MPARLDQRKRRAAYSMLLTKGLIRVGIAIPENAEFELLEVFVTKKGRLLTRQFLIDEIWGPDYFGDTKTLDVHVKRLRQKVEQDPHDPRHILTVRGLGYKFVD